MGLELEVTSLNLICTAFGLFFVVYGTFSYLIKERLFVGEPPIAVLVGIALGPYGLGGIFNWASKEIDIDEVSLGICRVVIGIQLTLVGVQLPYKYPWIELRSLFMLLVPVMTIMWLSTTLCIWLVIPGLPILVGLVIATAATPTDPVLSNAIVTGAFADQYVSPRIRNLISAESGANDGFGYPFLFLAVHLLKIESTGEALRTWLLDTFLYTVCGSVLYGIAVGFLCRKFLEFSTDRNLIDKESFLLYGSAMGVFIVGSGGLFQIDDLLAAFVAGNALSWTDFYREQCEESEVDNCVDLLLNLVFFTFLGATIPWDSFTDPDNGITPGRLVLMCILVLLFRRLPAMLAFYRFIPTLHDVSEACFIGYFAPIGAGALFYLGVILDEFKSEDESYASERIRVLVKPITYSLILASILCHSLTIPFVKIAFTYWGIQSIKLEGESEKGDHDDDGDDGSVAEADEEEVPNDTSTRPQMDDTLEGAYDPGEYVDSRGPEDHRRDSRASRTSQVGNAESFRHSTFHRPEDGRPLSQYEPFYASGSGGAYRADGTWDERASWRNSTTHKLAPHHQLRRNETTGQLELDPQLYTLVQRAPFHSRPNVSRRRSSRYEGARASRSRSRPDEEDDEQGLLEQGRSDSRSYGSIGEPN